MALRREDEGQFERMAALHRVPLNNIFPIEDNCDENGGFLPRHCDADERTCFCVDDTGKKIPRSELRAFEGVCGVYLFSETTNVYIRFLSSVFRIQSPR